MSRPPDRDTQEVCRHLRAAITDSGLSQAAFARALGTSPPRLSTYLSGQAAPSAALLMRAARLGRALGLAAARGLMSAPVTAAEMRHRLQTGDIAWTWRMLLQGREHLGQAIQDRDQQLLDAWEARPGTTNSAEWDALLAAVVAHDLCAAGLPEPSWTRDGPLETPWVPEHPFLSPERVRAQTPDWLRRRNIFVPARDLVSA